MKKIILIISTLSIVIIGIAYITKLIQYNRQTDMNMESSGVYQKDSVKTKVIQYTPNKLPDIVVKGSCWTSSISTQREGTWRCAISSRPIPNNKGSIMDPCFEIKNSDNLVCNPNPIFEDTGILLQLTEPLPAHDYTLTDSEGWGWLIQLTDGGACYRVTGTSLAPYVCIKDGVRDSYLLNILPSQEMWIAEQVPLDKILPSENTSAWTVLVPIQTVWQ